jgi:hypothetical protein
VAETGGDGVEYSAPVAFAVGATVGPYVIDSTIARGGQGIVLRARDPRLDRWVAIKVVDDSDGESIEGQLVGEARSLAKLSHPNILPVFDVGITPDGRVWVAMELVEGTTIDVWARRVSRERVLRAWLDVGRAVSHAHAAGVLHRDIKPGNVMVDVHDRVRVLDFGLQRDSSTAKLQFGSMARQFAASSRNSGISVVGTMGFMAPELFRGAELTPQSDQFSYCIALYHALFAADPFGGSPRRAWVKALPEAPQSRSPKSALERSLEAVLLRGLAPDPASRWPSMDALVDALERALDEVRSSGQARASAPVQVGVVTMVLGAALVALSQITTAVTAGGLLGASLVVALVVGLATLRWRERLFRSPYTRTLVTVANVAAWSSVLHRALNHMNPVPTELTLRGDALVIAALSAYVGVAHDKYFLLSAVASAVGGAACALWPASAALAFGGSQLIVLAVFLARAFRVRADDAP